MTEVELNVLFNITPERTKNRYIINSKKDFEKIQRIIKTFEISKQQRSTFKDISVRSLAAFKTILTSNN